MWGWKTIPFPQNVLSLFAPSSITPIIKTVLQVIYSGVKMSHMKRNFVMMFILLLVLSFGSYTAFRSTKAAGIVGTGTPDSCTEAALLSAIEGGGSINF